MAPLVAAIIALIAVAIAPGYWYYFDVTPKVVILLAGTAIALIAGGSRFRPSSWFGWLLAGSAASLVLSALFSTNRALSWFGSNWRRFGVVEQGAILLLAWLVAIHAAGRPNRVRIILRGVVAACLAAGVYGILQYFGRDPLLPAAAYHVGEGIWAIVRPPGTLGYVSYFANWLAMNAFLSLALAQMEERPLLRYSAYAAAAVGIGAMLLTGTRGALLASLAGCAALVYGRAWCPARRSVTVAAVLGVAGITFYISPAGWNLHSRVRWFREDPRGGARLELWRDTLGMSIHRLPAGFGPEVFTAQFPHYESKQLAESYPDFAHESPHNMFLDALVAEGLPGLVILLVLCVFALARAPSPWLRAALVTGIVAQQFTVFTIPTAVLFYMVVALCAGEAEQSRSQPSAAPSEPRPEGAVLPLYSANLNKAARSRVPRLVAACAASILLYFAFCFAAADRSLELARRSIQQSDGMAAARFYSAFERWRLPGAGSDLWYSRAMSALAQRTPNKLQRIQIAAQAGYAALRATRTAEDPFNAWYNAAALYASANDTVYAERSLRAAIAAHPNWFKPHWMLARVLLLEARIEEARREAEQAVELDAGKHKEVAETLHAGIHAALH